MSESNVNISSEEQEENVKEDISGIDQTEGNEFVLVDDGNSHDPSESEGQTKGEEEGEKDPSEIREEGDEEHPDIQEEPQKEEDVNPMEEEELETVEEDDYEERGEKRSMDALQMTPADIHDMVNEALDFKLGSFQAQLHQMMAVIQNVSQHGGMEPGQLGRPVKQPPQEVAEQHRETKVKVNHDEETMDDSQKEEEVSNATSKEQEATEEDVVKQTKEKDAAASGRAGWEEDADREKWEEYLAKVSAILDLMPATEEKSVLDDTMTSSGKSSLSFLPAEGIIKKSWQKVRDQNLMDVASVSKKQNHRYYWPMNDMRSYGWNPKMNPEIAAYIVKAQGFQGKRGRSGRNVLPENLSRVNHDILSIDDLFHYQRRVISYASYFLGALGKVVKGENDVDEETRDELLNNLGQCLIDICDTSVKGSVFATRGRRRVHLDAMKVFHNKARSELVNQPMSFDLFPTDTKSILEKYQVHLQTPSNEGNRKQSGGGVSSGGNVRGGAASFGNNSGGGGNRGGSGRNDKRGGAQGGNKMGSAGGSGGHGTGGSRASQGAGGRIAPTNRNRGNAANRDGRQNDGGQKSGRGKRRNSGDGRGGQGNRPSSSMGGGGGRNKRRRVNNKSMSPNRMWGNVDSRFGTEPYSMIPTLGGGYTGMDFSRMKPDSSENKPLFSGSYKNILGNNNPGPFQTSSLGGGYYRPGDAASYMGYMSFSEDRSPMATEGFQGSDDEVNQMY